MGFNEEISHLPPAAPAQPLGREGAVDIVKILCAFLIVCFHIPFAMGIQFNLQFNRFFTTAIGQWGIWAVDFFFVSSAFYLSNGRFHLRHFLRELAIVALFVVYQSVLYVIYHVHTGQATVGKAIADILLDGFIRSPLWSNVFWFATVYLLIYTLFPFVRKGLDRLTDRQLGLLMLFLIPVFFFSHFRESQSNMEDLSFYLAIYILVYWLKRKNFHPQWWLSLSVLVVVFVQIVSLRFYFDKITGVTRDWVMPLFGNVSRHSLTMLTGAVFAFYLARSFHIRGSQPLRFLAGGTFTVYLFHANPYFSLLPHLVNEVMPTLFVYDAQHFNDDPRMPGVFLLIALYVFVVGMTLGALLNGLFALLEKKGLHKLQTLCDHVDTELNS